MSLSAARGSLRRGTLAGAIGGTVFGLFLATVVTPLIAHAETFEAGHEHGSGHALSGLVTTLVSTLGGMLFGLLLGVVVFGAGYYLLEPVLPSPARIQSYLLGCFGFVIVSGAPWLVVPPQPPGMTASLSTGARIGWYVVMMGIGALACAIGAMVARQIDRSRLQRYALGALAGVSILGAGVVLAPTVSVSGPIPQSVAHGFRWVSIGGQLGLWFVLASVHAWLG
ncbi:CbtA family protein [Halocatena halophila]|uniref:CbtA family protein n=1 Tax=Halocatena halophila TaxID=2814576 RepID=UPI002ED05FE3